MTRLEVTYPDVDAVLAWADRLDRAGLLRLASRTPPRAVLDAARQRAYELIRREGLEDDRERLAGEVVAWSFVDGARVLAYSIIPPINGDVQLADLRSQAAPALLDALVATMLGPALDRTDADVLLADWRAATEGGDDQMPGRPVGGAGAPRLGRARRDQAVLTVGILILIWLLLAQVAPLLPWMGMGLVFFAAAIVVVVASVRPVQHGIVGEPAHEQGGAGQPKGR